MSVFRQLIDKKALKILDLFLKNRSKFLHLKKISEDSGVPISSTFRVINRLVSLGVVEVTVVGKMKIYRIADNGKTKELESALKGKK